MVAQLAGYVGSEVLRSSAAVPKFAAIARVELLTALANAEPLTFSTCARVCVCMCM